MSEIKTKDVVKGTVKAIDKSAVTAEHIKNAYIRTKEKAEHGIYTVESSPNEYAADRMAGSADSGAREVVRQFDKQGRRGIRTTQKNSSKIESSFQKRPAQKRAAQGPRHSADTVQKSIKTFGQGEKAIKQTAKSTGKAMVKSAKGTIKTAQKSIKTATHTSRIAIKTTQQAVNTAQKTAQATEKAAKLAAHTARVATKAAATTAKAVSKAIILAIKATIVGTKALIAVISAWGWIAVLVIVIICSIGLITLAYFGVS